MALSILAKTKKNDFQTRTQVALEEFVERDTIGWFEPEQYYRKNDSEAVDFKQASGSLSFNKTRTDRPEFNFSQWLGMDKFDLVSEGRSAGSAIWEVAKTVTGGEKTVQVDQQKGEDQNRKVIEFQFQKQQQTQLETQIKQARTQKETQEEERFTTAGLSNEALAKEAGIQVSFKMIRSVATRAWVALKMKWKAQKQKAKQSPPFAMAAGRGKTLVNLNAVVEGGTGGAKMNISATGGGAG